MEDRPLTVTVPTELERADAFIDFTVLASAALLSSWLVQHGLPWPMLLPGLVPLAVWALTGEGAADIPYIGSVAAGLRARFGLRRAHEWVLAYSWYCKVAILPVWREHCEASFRSCQRRTTALRQRLSARILWKRLPACSWACRIPSRSFRRRGN